MAQNSRGNEVVEFPYVYNYISTGATTVVKAAPGTLHTITVNGGTAGTVIVYDDPAQAGTIIASFDSTNAKATYIFDVVFTLGLTIITSAATKITVSYI